MADCFTYNPKTSASDSSEPDFPTRRLLRWYRNNRRKLPWRDSSDPYCIWISEVMLQQTRVETVIPYYRAFITSFPTVQELAKAERQDVLKIWEGLGYYSRARNLHDAARYVVKYFDGQLPDTDKEIRKLKGIGPYTAAALLSIAFEKPYAVVDGNVLRVFSRFFGIAEDIRNQAVRNRIQELAQESLDPNHPGDFNQAVMELGATVCKPSSPDCQICPLLTTCTAYRTASTNHLPYKSPAKKIPHYSIGVGLIVNPEGLLLIALRPEKGMLGGLWEFPGGKQKQGESLRQTVQREVMEECEIQVDVLDQFMKVDHAYSHFKISLHAFWCRSKQGEVPVAKTSQEVRWVRESELLDYPFPKANRVLTQKLMADGIPLLNDETNEFTP